MKVLLSGAGGYVGGRVVEQGRGQHEIAALWRNRQPPDGATNHQLDLADRAAVERVVSAVRPDVVIHAAYEMAAPAEQNLLWSRNLFAAAQAVGSRSLLVSTDLVFDGTRGWYAEGDEQNPTLAYGAWKAELEREVLAAGGVVARTSLVWGIDPVGHAVDTVVMGPLRAGNPPHLFEDEWRTPTEVRDLADGLLAAAELSGPRVLHLSGPERLSRLEFGRLIAAYYGYDPAILAPYRRAEIAPSRPADTSLATDETRRHVNVRFRGPSEILKPRR
jgi:dTDP-4-dehydrorhamnose reductase